METLGTGFYVGFMIIVLMIPLVLYLLKRSPLSRSLGGMAEGAPMRILNSMALGPGQKIITLEVGKGPDRRWLIVGITSQSMTTLHEISVGSAGQSEAESPPLEAFQQLFSRLQSRVKRHG